MWLKKLSETINGRGMSNTLSSSKRQKRTGYILVAVAAVLQLGGILAILYYDVPQMFYLGMLVPAGILVFLGYRKISAGRRRQIVQDKRSRELYRKAGSTSFWWLLVIVFADGVFSVFPDNQTQISFVFVGLIIYGMNLGYYRYIELRK
ncbi:hypothetical protein [Saliphagus infecundisoli]|uniref:DUF2178 domain-containing protein n=1 Tax=Saliphagus infecundisoli TaxID=1849069 RepID=A0ABD5QI35_9EURY|nr:hypothetical protein [Saliphagus infecundisoli]